MIEAPGGRLAVRQDLAHIVLRELPATGERRYGLAYQVWETDPRAFVRRVVVAWLPVEEMPDAMGFRDELPGPDGTRVRRQMWDMIAGAMSANELDPDSDVPPLGAYPPGVQHDPRLARGVMDNLEALRDTWCVFAAWQPDGEAFWVRTQGFFSCVGLDGSVSPRLALERKGLGTTTWLPVAEYSHDVEGLPGRRLRETFADGTAFLDGSPREDVMRPYVVPVADDGWVAAEHGQVHPAPSAPSASTAGTVTVRVADWSPEAVVGGIVDLTRQLTDDLPGRADDSRIVIRFVVGDDEVSEDEFFDRVRDEVPEASAALGRLVDRAAEVMAKEFLFSDPEEGVGLLARAVRAYGVLAPDPWPTLTAYGRVVDAEHEYTFAGETVPAVLAARGWSSEAVDFVFWVMIRNYFNTLPDLEVVWTGWGLRGAVVDRDPVALARRVVDLHLDDIVSRRYEVSRHPGGLEQLAGDLPEPYEPWVEAFLVAASDRLTEV
jgi:hypothetical protein